MIKYYENNIRCHSDPFGECWLKDNGVLHREDGPAIFSIRGLFAPEYWINGTKINTEKQYWKLIKMKAFW
jgi:hypothetical protein